jgi:hypothetical protein
VESGSIESSSAINHEAEAPSRMDINMSKDYDDNHKIIPLLDMNPIEVPHDSITGEDSMTAGDDGEPPTASPSVTGSIPRESMMSAAPQHTNEDDTLADQVTTLTPTVNDDTMNKIKTTESQSANYMTVGGNVGPSTKSLSFPGLFPTELMMTAAPLHEKEADTTIDQVTTLTPTVNDGKKKNMIKTTSSPPAFTSKTETPQLSKAENGGMEAIADTPNASYTRTSSDENTDQHVSPANGDNKSIFVGSLNVASPMPNSPMSHTIHVPNDRSSEMPKPYPAMKPSTTRIQKKLMTTTLLTNRGL